MDTVATSAGHIEVDEEADRIGHALSPALLPVLPAVDEQGQIGDFAAYDNHLRYHESITNLTPANINFARVQTILLKKAKIKRQTIENRRLNYRRIAA